MINHFSNLSPEFPFRFWLPWWFLFIVTALSFATWTPPFQYPDEPTHLAGALESIDPANREIRENQLLQLMQQYRFWELAAAEIPETTPLKFYQAPLLRKVPTQFSKPLFYYRTAGHLLRLAKIDNLLTSIIFLRLLGVLLAGFAIFIFGLILQIVLPDNPWQAVAIAAVAVPQFAYMSGALNPSNIAWISGSLILLASLLLLQQNKRILGWVILLGSLFLCIFTHRAALAILPAAFFSIWYGGRRLQRQHMPIWFWLLAGSVSSIATVFICWKQPAIIRSIFIRAATITLQLHVNVADSAFDLSWWKVFLSFFGKSLILNFGWLSLTASGWIYILFGCIGAIGLFGWLLSLVTFRKPGFSGNFGQGIVLWIAAVVMFWAAAGQYAVNGILSQGRYLFAAWPAIACIVVLGWSVLIPKKYWMNTIIILCAVIWSTSLWSLWKVMIIGFYF